MSAKNPGGRPPRFRSPEAMQAKIDAYFEACQGEVLKNDFGQPVLNKWGEAVMVDVHPPTMTGLALALGFRDRSSLLDYQAKPRFEEIIVRAKSRIEQYAEERLFDKDGSAGARFSLQNNFKRWKETRDVNLTAVEGADIMAEVEQRMAGETGDDLIRPAFGGPPSPEGEGSGT